MDLFAPLKRALAEQQYETATPIQAQTIPAAIAGKDILGCAQTGTGKTAAFALPILDFLGHENFRAKPNRPAVLVLAPTRELAIQIRESFATYGKHLKFRQALVYGGVGQGDQVKAMASGVHILIATPGRLIDLMDQRHIDLQDVEIFVLDEADRMLDMGFMPALKRIVATLPRERQSLFFSATMPPKIRELADELLREPVCVNVTPKETSVQRIEQQVRIVDKAGKFAAIREVLSQEGVERTIVFARTKRGANTLTEQLDRSGVRAAVIHGNKSQNARQRALEDFRKQRVQVLVATDVAARGIDIDGVTHVINYDMPTEPESYVHRIGRTGRAGAAGVAISFCTSAEREELRAIEKLIGRSFSLEGSFAASSPSARNATGSGSNRRPAPRSGRGNQGRRRPMAAAGR